MKYTYNDREQSSGSGLIPEGLIALQVMDSEYTCDKISPKTGNEYISLQMQMVGKYENGQWVKCGGGKLFDMLVFTDKVMWKIDAFLSSCGKAPEKGTEINLTARKCVGWVAYAVVTHEEQDNINFPKKAVVQTYIKSTAQEHPLSKAQAPEPEPAPLDTTDYDDVPF